MIFLGKTEILVMEKQYCINFEKKYKMFLFLAFFNYYSAGCIDDKIT